MIMEENAMDKRKTALVICAVLFFAAVLLSALFADDSLIPNGDTGGRYPYTMTSDGKNVNVKIKGPFEEGYHWVCNKDADTVLKLVSQDQNEKNARFVITTQSGMVETAVFSLQNDTMTEDVIYKIMVALNASPEGAVTVVTSNHEESEKVERFASDSDTSYYITEGESGEIVVVVEDASPSDWSVKFDSEGAVVVNGEEGDAQFRATIKSLRSGESPVFICNKERGTAIFFDVLSDSLGFAEILDHEIVPISEAVIEKNIYSMTDISDADISGGDIE